MDYKRKISTKELIFQAITLAVAALFFIFDRQEEVIDLRRVPSFITFSIGALFTGYVLLPKYFYKKKYIHFGVSFLAVVIIIILLEEFVIEQIVYPDTRALDFQKLNSLVEIIPVLVILTSFKFAWDLNAKQRAIEALSSAAKESELKFLKSQINPHFLFNNLNNLYSYSITDASKTSDIILELSSVLRYMLYECKEDWVPLEKEIDHLGKYISLNELQIEERGKVTFQTDNRSSGYKIAPLLLMVFIENAFKHSTASISEGINIGISLSVSENGHLSFVCKNNYEQIGNNENLSGGIGLENVRKRLDLLYPEKYNLSINDDKKSYEVDLSIQLNQDNI